MESFEKQLNLKTLMNDKQYKKLYFWAVSKLSMMKPLYWSLVLVVAISAYGAISLVEKGETVPWEVWGYFLGLPLVAAVVVVVGLPRMVFRTNLKQRLEVRGESYRVMCNANGVSINGKLVLWDSKYQRWEGKYGIAMTRGMQIVTLFPKHLYTDEEYRKLKEWMQLF